MASGQSLRGSDRSPEDAAGAPQAEARASSKATRQHQAWCWRGLSRAGWVAGEAREQGGGHTMEDFSGERPGASCEGPGKPLEALKERVS